jgi:hypothetical protein
MSSPMDGATDPLAYAPKWARDAALAKRDEEYFFRSAIAEEPSTIDTCRTECSLAARSLDPIILPPPTFRSLWRGRFAIAGGLAISVAAGAITALFVMGELPSWGLVTKDDRLEAASLESRFVGPTGQASKLDLFSYASQLASVNIASEPANQEPLLAEPLRGATADHVTSTRTTDGSSPTEPANQEPLLAEPLRGATVVTEQTSPTWRALNPDEIAAFLKRGQELIASGDIAGARVILLRTAEARDPKGALALAATFDPIMLKKIGAYGIVADVSSARSWYEKAKEFGSEEAPRRLEMLAEREM